LRIWYFRLTLKAKFCIFQQKKNTKIGNPIFYFKGPYGVGKQSAAEAACHELRKRLLYIEGDILIDSEGLSFEEKLTLVLRESKLQGAAIYWKGFDALLSEDKRTTLGFLLKALEEHHGLTFLSGEEGWEPRDALHQRTFASIVFSVPAFGERLELWQRSLNGNTPISSDLDLYSLSNKFILSGGQIRDIVATARNHALKKGSENENLNMKTLYTACRAHSNQKLSELSKKIKPKFTWNDIVLPQDKLSLLNEIINHVKYKQKVYVDWGFEEKISLGKGLTVLFSGPSGTGKTMAAEIIAGELDLDIYKIDLSLIVSKYIGETEKNLSKIFAEAETSNAILFFDEADALFGKRSEVKDSHDRYANIEIAYLLQKMEEYEGITILASNLRKNLDDAFVRRIKFIIEFPIPDEPYRYQIWQVHLPRQAPIEEDLDFEFLARNFKLTGGNIKNSVLHAAFLSASEESTINMKHIVQGIQREFQKAGKVCVKGDFGRYFELLSGND
jgi:SpoVK/Ycf46/Vps4 family AAA+-type ATPase